MPCTPVGNAVVCSPPRGVVRRRYEWCPVCQRRRRFIQSYGGAYYGDTLTCLGCGDSWTAGYRMTRPFMRGWRTKAISKAKRRWAEAMTPAEYRRAVRAELQAHFPAEAGGQGS